MYYTEGLDLDKAGPMFRGRGQASIRRSGWLEEVMLSCKTEGIGINVEADMRQDRMESPLWCPPAHWVGQRF